jgi:hypothetical protein
MGAGGSVSAWPRHKAGTTELEVTTMSNTTAAVTFDAAAFRNWLDSDGNDGRKVKESDPFLSVAYTNEDGEAGWLVASLLSGTTPGGWTTALGVAVNAHALASEEGGDYGVAVEVQVDGSLWLSAGTLTPQELVPVADDAKLPGYEAAVIALENVADAANAVVDRLRASYERKSLADVVADTYNANRDA